MVIMTNNDTAFHRLLAPSSSSSSSTATAPPESTRASNGGGRPKGGGGPSHVTATILSTYDLPSRDPPPLHVELSILNESITTTADHGNPSARTGPPTQRHKDRHSFKFNADTLVVSNASLAQLYQSTARISVVYPPELDPIAGTTSTTVLSATYALSQLKIHETVWLVLPLTTETSGTTTALTNTNTDTEETQPTVRLQLTLAGPYRSEISLGLATLNSWFRTVDEVQKVVDLTVLAPLHTVVLEPLVALFTTTVSSDQGTTRHVNFKYVLLPAAPLLVGLAVTLPIVIGIIIVTLPLALPILVALAAALCGMGLVATLLYASTASGRVALTPLLTPMIQTLLSTPVGQGLVYNIGPRPTPVSLCRTILPHGMWSRFGLSVVIDMLGSSSYLLPGVGEGFDLAWAPIQTVLIMALYNTETSASALDYLKYVSFAEEILPFTDILPTATIGWCMEYGLPLVQSKLHAASSTDHGSSHHAPGTTPSRTTNAPVSLREMVSKQQ